MRIQELNEDSAQKKIYGSNVLGKVNV